MPGMLRRTGWPGRKRSRTLVLLSMFFTAAYLGWWSVGGHVGNPVLFGLLLGAELFNIVHLVGLWQAIWSGGLELPPPGETHFTVDVFIPTYGEPLDVLRRTIEAAVSMDHPHHTYVLDDAVRDEVRRLAEDLGADYISRSSAAGAKAGNLNNALERTDGDLIVVFDADHVARRDFLTHLLGYFEDETVGIVQSPQFYGNAVTNPVARGAWFQQTPFYGPILRGKADLGAAFMCGTNAVIRREALREVGGFVEDSVVEDFVTTLGMHRRGWDVVYFPYVLSEGEGPPTQRAYFDQQFRWASGSLNAFLSFEPFKGDLHPWQRIQHLLATTFYLVGFTTLIYLSLPVLSLIGRTGPFGVGAATFPLFYVPYAATTLLAIAYSLRWRFGLRNMQFTFGSFPVYIAAALTALTGREISFSATGAEDGDQRPHPLAYVTVLAFLTLLLSVILAPLVQPWDAWAIISLFWATIDLALLWRMTRITVTETLGSRRQNVAPDVPETATEPPTTATYVLGAFPRPPLPEHVIPEFEERRASS